MKPAYKKVDCYRKKVAPFKLLASHIHVAMHKPMESGIYSEIKPSNLDTLIYVKVKVLFIEGCTHFRAKPVHLGLYKVSSIIQSFLQLRGPE